MKRFTFITFWAVIASHVSVAYYDAYPKEGGPYVSGPVSESLPWVGEDFETYINGSTIECSNDKNQALHLDVTSGCLTSKYAGQWRRGYTSTHNFRVVANGFDAWGRKIKWTTMQNSVRVFIKEFHEGELPSWAGIHLFARYRTSDDLYVVSYRFDGKVTIKRKWDGRYHTLAIAPFRLSTGRWYDLTVIANGRSLAAYANGQLITQAQDSTFSWGTAGIRIDYAYAYLDDWEIK